jgi:hypothetical protein
LGRAISYGRGYGARNLLWKGVWGAQSSMEGGMGALAPPSRGISSQEKTTPHVRMSSLSDTLTIGVVLVLLFGSIALYLYTRIQQAEQKVNLLESILLDVKMSAEIKSYSDLPADVEKPSHQADTSTSPVLSTPTDEYITLDDLEEKKATPLPVVEESVYLPMDNTEQEKASEEIASEEIASEEIASDSSDLLLNAAPVEISYENMTLKDLQTLAKSRHITGVSTMKKGALVDALKASKHDALVVEEITA